MKTRTEIKQRIDNYENNKRLAQKKAETEQAVNYITAAMKELQWVINEGDEK